jgi:hypothetical protein
MRRLIPAILCGLLWAGVASAQDDEPTEEPTTDEEVVEEEDALEGEEDVDEGAVEDAEDYLEDVGPGLGMVIRHRDITATFQIFGDIGFSWDNPAPKDRGHTSFFIGSLSWFFTAQVGDHFQVLWEVQGETVRGDPADDVEFDVERLWGSWTFSDRLYIKFGLEHNDISRWNRLYHHGRWLEISVVRPFLARFEGSGWLPMHNTGIEFGGRFGTKSGPLYYTIIFANGRGEIVQDPQKISDRNDGKSIDLGLRWAPKGSPGLQVGIHGRMDEIPGDGTGAGARAGSIDQRIATAFVSFQRGKTWLMAEYAYISDDDNTSGMTFTHHIAYVMFGYQYNDKWMPYIRLDVLDMEPGDPFYAPAGRDMDKWEIPVGVRYDFVSNATLKFELGFGERDQDVGGIIESKSTIRFAIQLAFVF